MKIFNTKRLSGKLILALILIILLNTTIVVNISYAGVGALIGGTLIDPICDLFLGIGDGIMSIVQKSIFGIDGEISVDLTGKTPWYVWLARSGCCIDGYCCWSYNYRRYFGICSRTNRNYRNDSWGGSNCRYYYNFCCISWTRSCSRCIYD